MQTATHINTATEDTRTKELSAILYLLQSNLEHFIDEVDKGYQLFTQIGEKTELVQSIEKMVDNPLGNLSKISDKIDVQIRFIIDKFVKGFLEKKKELINKILISDTSLSQLHYSIVLRNDNMENRLAIFDFLSFYYALDVSSKYPVYFQFVPIELSDKIKHKEEVNFS